MQAQNQYVIIAAVVGFIIGAIIFWLIGRSGKGAEENPLQKPYNDLKKEFEAYKAEVSKHFTKTADAVDHLTKSYQDVFTHLSQGAEKLMDEQALKLAREKRQGKAVTLAYLSPTETEKNEAKTAPVTSANTSANQKPLTGKPLAASSENTEKATSAAPVTPRPAEATKPSTAPKADVKSESSLDTAKAGTAPTAKTEVKPEAPKTIQPEAQQVLPSKKEGNPQKAGNQPTDLTEKDKTGASEKTSVLKAAEKAGLKANDEKTAQTEGIEAVKRHIHANQPKSSS
ncbi:ZapG family protein [Suttonella ornithocola]|uniref:Z-ring associated protein G n=1 Tax=Suttonella ornithocola TaxID=279832 RepID=A0A380MNY1_9GAMM|nr:DUF1043 family protein [Suttonella ornithocola]SUO94329.1 Putative cytochrome d ubiquinol oxidase subunit 3 [Suttonella ornithocola]